MTTQRAPRGQVRTVAAALCLALAVWAITTFPVRAQPITVVAGEHRGFTRVVLQSSGGFAWTLQQDGALLRIRLPQRDLRLNPDQLFARIPRTRLAGARVEGSELELTLACRCPVTRFEDRQGVVVLDLHDGPPLAPVTIPDPAPAAGRALARRLAFSWPGEQAESQVPLRAEPSGGALDALRAALATGLASAMTQGLVAVPDTTGTGPAQVLPGPVADPPSALPPNLRLRGAAEASPPPEPAAPPNPDCPAEAELAFLDDPPQPFADHLASLRVRLFGEFDRPEAGARLDLARHYLSWGLGTEARQVLDAPPPLPQAPLLAALADVLDDVASNRRAALAGLTGCPGPAAVFAALAGPPDPGLAEAADRLTATFLRLPTPVRTAVGPDLMERFLHAGVKGPARIVLNALADAPPGERPAPAVLARLEARLEHLRGADARAGTRLASEPALDLEAVRLALELALAEGRSPPPTVLEDAAALAEPLRGTESARATLELIIRHHALAGRIAQGLALLDRYERWLEPTPSNRQRLAALRGMLWNSASGTPDAAFLELVLGRNDWRGAELPADVRFGIAARLEGLGLAMLAASMSPANADRTEPDRAGPSTAGAGEAVVPPNLASGPSISGHPTRGGGQDSAGERPATLFAGTAPMSGPSDGVRAPFLDGGGSGLAQEVHARPGTDSGAGPVAAVPREIGALAEQLPRPPTNGGPVRPERAGHPLASASGMAFDELGGVESGLARFAPPDPTPRTDSSTGPQAVAPLGVAETTATGSSSSAPPGNQADPPADAMAASQQALRDSEILRGQLRSLLTPP